MLQVSSWRNPLRMCIISISWFIFSQNLTVSPHFPQSETSIHTVDPKYIPIFPSSPTPAYHFPHPLCSSRQVCKHLLFIIFAWNICITGSIISFRFLFTYHFFLKLSLITQFKMAMSPSPLKGPVPPLWPIFKTRQAVLVTFLNCFVSLLLEF